MGSTAAPGTDGDAEGPRGGTALLHEATSDGGDSSISRLSGGG